MMTTPVAEPMARAVNPCRALPVRSVQPAVAFACASMRAAKTWASANAAARSRLP
jgi:hypothetical protein